MSRRVHTLVRTGFTAGLLVVLVTAFQSCADSGRAPTSPSPAAQYTPRALSWECMHSSTRGADSGGWSFDLPAADCGVGASAVPDAGIGMVTVAPGNLRSTITGSTVRLDWDVILEPV